MARVRDLAALVAAASLAAPLAAGAAGLGARSTSASFTVSAVVVRSTPIALHAAALEVERAPAAPAQEPRRVAVPHPGPSAGAFAGGAATVVFVDGAPPSWSLRERRATEPARQ